MGGGAARLAMAIFFRAPAPGFALRNLFGRYMVLSEKQGTGLQPAPPDFKHGAGLVARPDIAQKPKTIVVCTRMPNLCSSRAAAAARGPLSGPCL